MRSLEEINQLVLLRLKRIEILGNIDQKTQQNEARSFPFPLLEFNKKTLWRRTSNTYYTIIVFRLKWRELIRKCNKVPFRKTQSLLLQDNS